MKKLFSIVILFVATFVNAQSVEDILKDHFNAIGQQKLAASNSLVIHGRISQLGVELAFTQYTSRPANFRIEGTIEGISFIQTYNGIEGWTVDPFALTPGPVAATGKQLISMKSQADIDGVLWNWKEKGSTISYEGKESVEGSTCFKLKIITADSNTLHYFIDSTTHYILRKNTMITMGGKPAISDTYFRNYTDFGGIRLAGTIENKVNGVTSDMIIVDQVEFNLVLDPQLFGKPG